MSPFFEKLRRRIEKSVLQYGWPATIVRCLFWPLMYVGWRLVEQGPAARRNRREGEAFDRRFGVDTERDRFSEWAADIDSPNWAEGVGYDATPPEVIRAGIDLLAIRHEEFTFIDVGCGKGRVLLVASEYPFKEIIGVEYAPDLAEVAERNVDIFHSDQQRCRNLRAVCHDAASFPLPDSPLVLFIAHPFGESVFHQFLKSVRESVDSHPRPVMVVYYDPICGPLLEANGFREVNYRELASRRLLPDFVFTTLRWFEIIGFRNLQGREYSIFELDSREP